MEEEESSWRSTMEVKSMLKNLANRSGRRPLSKKSAVTKILGEFRVESRGQLRIPLWATGIVPAQPGVKSRVNSGFTRSQLQTHKNIKTCHTKYTITFASKLHFMSLGLF
jgi:hypothetical protein